MLITSSALIILGGVLFFASAMFRTPEAPPFGSLNPRHWKPMWNREMRTWFRPPGYTLMVGGWALFVIGIAMHWIFIGWIW